eukprot:583929-Pelagomonas_calceolata.AAC.1
MTEWVSVLHLSKLVQATKESLSLKPTIYEEWLQWLQRGLTFSQFASARIEKHPHLQERLLVSTPARSTWLSAVLKETLTN